MSDRPNQRTLILEYIQEYGGITPLEAMRDLGVFALSQRIGEMKRKDLIEIETTSLTVKNRRGVPTTFACYRLPAAETLSATAPVSAGGATGAPDDGGGLLF